jgi:hypothetical protein
MMKYFFVIAIPEIYFIAFALLMHFNEEAYTKIYCG